MTQNPTETEASERVGSDGESLSDEMPRARGATFAGGDQRWPAALGRQRLEQLRAQA